MSTKVKFHGTEVKNIIISYLDKEASDPSIGYLKLIDVHNLDKTCDSINIQVVSDYVTITIYKKESTNTITRRELIPTHSIQRIWIDDMPVG